MTLTVEERAAQNRENAQRSTGPKSPEGKARSRINALKHGLRADALAMPGEDPALAVARAQAWNDYYKPQSPGAQHLVNECVRATLFSDRVDAYLAADAERRFAAIREEWVGARDHEIQAHIDGLVDNSTVSLANLKATPAGRRWLLDRWELIATKLKDVGILHFSEVENTSLLLVRRSPAAQRFNDLANALDRYRHRNPAWPEPEVARVQLDALIAAELAALRALEASRDDGNADADETTALASESALNLIPADDATARLHLRYQSEARTAFQRAFKELNATLKRDSAADRQEEATVEASPNEASAAAAVSPNEADIVVATARKQSMPLAQRDPTVRDERGLPTNMVNMCMVPGS